ncbi:hypothetical protein R5W24_005407 [Gemmata sp. JC717]|uniref:DUF4149 domain-containing protein n=1 Tax=Gemmata algarum TaxID=2975278 RepID=A0ABU5F6N4_9BACT|nr:hypothetical protein [Gemmata algarum]MDY3556244.1 hypothetical protein [Gemmata algarum]MDY3562437.1 hypothetical protein [Gemmata algarum]
MTSLRRFVVVQLLMVWQGGFLFYTSAVVPVGTELLGKVGQGSITARVTDALNAVGVVALAALALDLLLTSDPSRRRALSRWALWVLAAVCQGGLFYLHAVLESYMDPDRRAVMVIPPFYPTHRVYLWTSTVQWAACLLFAWLTLRAWRAEDAERVLPEARA